MKGSPRNSPGIEEQGMEKKDWNGEEEKKRKIYGKKKGFVEQFTLVRLPHF